jgi:hypothetical protein
LVLLHHYRRQTVVEYFPGGKNARPPGIFLQLSKKYHLTIGRQGGVFAQELTRVSLSPVNSGGLTMSSLRKVALATAFTITMVGMGLSPAKASTETWNFNNPTGILGNTQNYSSAGGFTATAAGFLSSGMTFTTPTALFGKNDGGANPNSIENGVGICGPACAVSGNTDNEITAGVSFIRIQLPTGVTNIHAVVNSVTNQGTVSTGGENFAIFGSTSATSGYIPVFQNGNSTNQGMSLTLGACPACTFFVFEAIGVQGGTNVNAANILVGSMTADIAAVPLPGALPLFATGMGLIGLLASRRKRKLA